MFSLPRPAACPGSRPTLCRSAGWSHRGSAPSAPPPAPPSAPPAADPSGRPRRRAVPPRGPAVSGTPRHPNWRCGAASRASSGPREHGPGHEKVINTYQKHIEKPRKTINEPRKQPILQQNNRRTGKKHVKTCAQGTRRSLRLEIFGWKKCSERFSSASCAQRARSSLVETG